MKLFFVIILAALFGGCKTDGQNTNTQSISTEDSKINDENLLCFKHDVAQRSDSFWIKLDPLNDIVQKCFGQEYKINSHTASRFDTKCVFRQVDELVKKDATTPEEFFREVLDQCY